MKQVWVFLIFLLSYLYSPAQGKYAGTTFKKLIGKTFSDEKHIKGLTGYQFREGSIITDAGDPDQQALDVLLKGNSGVVVFSVKADTTKRIFQIVDILEIKNIEAGWEIKTVGCKEGETEGQIIIAVVKPGKKEFTNMVKQAWRCNRDKIRFEGISSKGITCLNEGME